MAMPEWASVILGPYETRSHGANGLINGFDNGSTGTILKK